SPRTNPHLPATHSLREFSKLQRIQSLSEYLGHGIWVAHVLVGARGRIPVKSNVIATAYNSILIIDDDPDIRDALGDALMHDGYRVDAVGCGTEAIARASQAQYGAAVLDMRLPDLDGQVVLRGLIEVDPKLPVVVLTGKPTIETRVGSFTKGAFAYV